MARHHGKDLSAMNHYRASGSTPDASIAAHAVNKPARQGRKSSNSPGLRRWRGPGSFQKGGVNARFINTRDDCGLFCRGCCRRVLGYACIFRLLRDYG